MKNKSLLIQLIISIFFIIVMFLGVVGFSYYKITSNSFRQLTRENTQQTIQQSSQFVSLYLNKLSETTKSLSHNVVLKEYLEHPSEQTKEKAMFLMRSVLESDLDLVSANLVLPNGEVFSTDTTVQMDMSKELLSENWYQQAIGQTEMMPVLVPAHLQKIEDMDEWVISIAQEISNPEGENLGVLRLDIDYSTISNYLDHLDLGNDGFTFITNEKHEFVYHPEKVVYVSKEQMDKMKPYISIEDGYTKDYAQYVYQVKIPKTDWTLVGVSSLQGLRKIESQTVKTFVGFGLGSLVVCIFAVLLALRYWIKPIEDLQIAIQKIRQGEKNIRVKEKGAMEIRDLTIQFNKMLDSIDHLMKEVQENERSIRQYELQALSSQINPHFLYNTLDTIVWMAEFNDGKKVVEVTKSLARYFRLALNQGNQEISLKDEIDHVRQYLFIQKQRYGDRLNYQIDEIEKFNQFQLPKLILQPIVENAIYHGIKEVQRDGRIHVFVINTNTHIKISVWDNGAGFDQSLKNTNNTFHKTGSIGLKNVDQRLRLYFGKEYHMEIDSKKDEYTCISLYLPKIK